jgi:hypothetical protein
VQIFRRQHTSAPVPSRSPAADAPASTRRPTGWPPHALSPRTVPAGLPPRGVGRGVPAEPRRPNALLPPPAPHTKPPARCPRRAAAPANPSPFRTRESGATVGRRGQCGVDIPVCSRHPPTACPRPGPLGDRVASPALGLVRLGHRPVMGNGRQECLPALWTTAAPTSTPVRRTRLAGDGSPYRCQRISFAWPARSTPRDCHPAG